MLKKILSTRPTTRRLVGVVFCIVLVTSLGAAPAAAQGETQEEFLVDLDASGDAAVSLTLTYDLDSDEEREAFRELQENATAQDEFAERFENRMSAVAADASDATGREMSIGDASVEIRETDDTGVIKLTISWTNLAAVDGDRLTVTEPFASGFDPGMAFTVVIPEGYERVSVTPEPSSSNQSTATWEAGTDFQGYQLVTEPVSEDETDDDGTGFGLVGAVVALLAVALLVGRRRT